VRRRTVIAAAGALVLAATGLALAALRPWEDAAPARGGARPPSPGFPGGHPIDAAQVTSGRLSMERLPEELGTALELQSAEIVKNAEALESKQARITGVCAPGSAIRVIAADGSVSCQRLPRGVVSVPALAGVARLSSTVTAQGTVPGGVGRFQERGEDDYLVVPIPLPDGAVITSFSYVFFDAADAIDGVAYLYRSDDQSMAGVSTSGVGDGVRVVTTEEIHLPRVDAARYAYFVYFQVSATAGANLLPISASVAYRLP
jgi:hypothetical protein